MELPKAETIGILSNSRILCATLDKYRLPCAIVHVANRSFVAWNRAFLRLTGFSEDQLWDMNAKDCVILGDPVAEAPGLVACVLRTEDGERFLTGQASIGDDGSVYVMPDLEDGTSDALEQGRIVGRQEERARIKGVFHEAATPAFSAAIVTLTEAKRRLKAKHAVEAEEFGKAMRLIVEASEKIVDSLEP
jgi:hypothetical protein